MLKYPFAIYEDENGIQQKVWPHDLHDAERRAFARTAELWDSEGEYRLYPRYRVDCPHFYALSAKKRSYTRPVETDPAHNQRVDELLVLLSRKGANFRIGFYDWDNEDRQLACFTRTKNYRWGKEVTRVLTSTVRCRHDLFGATADLNLTARFPWVAIEVVKHHYPDQPTFAAMLELTRELPCVILFDFVDVPNYFLKVHEATNEIRVIYYLFDGSVWRNGSRWESCTAACFREKIAQNIREVRSKSAEI